MESRSDGRRPGGIAQRLNRLPRLARKPAIVAAVIAFVVYRFHFAPISVNSHPARIGPIVSQVMGTGTLEARVAATLSPKISGLIMRVLVDQGDRITQGRLLATL